MRLAHWIQLALSIPMSFTRFLNHSLSRKTPGNTNPQLRLIQAHAELLQSSYLPPEERVNFERQLKTMKNQLE